MSEIRRRTAARRAMQRGARGLILANRPETEAWLLDHGYALAASKFQGDGTGYLVEQALRDQIALLDWVGAHVGRPRRQLARSSQRSLVRQAYRAAGLDLRGDLERLAAAPRIAADPAALRYIHRYGVVRGNAPVPVVTLHTTGDGGAVPDQERWYASQVRRSSDPSRLRQLYIDRGMHCSFSAAEEIVTMRTLFGRIATGPWPDGSPHRLNAAAGRFGSQYHIVLDLGNFQEAPMAPAFTRFAPPRFLRPSR